MASLTLRRVAFPSWRSAQAQTIDVPEEAISGAPLYLPFHASTP